MKGSVYSFSGTHSTGKSRAAAGKYEELKMLHPGKSIQICCDLEGMCPYPINTRTTPEAQEWLFVNQIRTELEVLRRFDILVTDRTIVDIIAYTMYAGFDSLASGMMELAGSHLPVYREIHFKQIKYNDYLYADGIRDGKNRQFRQDVENILLQLYTELSSAGHIPGCMFYG